METTPRRYEIRRLTKEEQLRLEQMLFEQMENQRWYSIVVLKQLVAEIMIPLN